jgi:hypothetical protein
MALHLTTGMPKKLPARITTKVAELLSNSDIICPHLKVAAAITNAKVYLHLREEVGGLDTYLWKFVNGTTIVNQIGDYRHTPVKTALSERISKDLVKRGFKDPLSGGDVRLFSAYFHHLNHSWYYLIKNRSRIRIKYNSCFLLNLLPHARSNYFPQSRFCFTWLS